MKPALSKYLLLIVGAGIIFIPMLGHVHLFDWDEINFAECAREMMASGDYLRLQIDYKPFYEKPPLFIWLQALSMHFLGVNEFAARLPNAICGILSLIFIFRWSSKLFHESLARWWVLLYIGSWLPHFYFKSGIIDPVFNLFIFLSVVHGSQMVIKDSHKMHACLAGLFIGLAVLTKGPVGVLIPLLCLSVHILLDKFRDISWSAILLTTAIAIPVMCSWFLADLLVNGPSMILAFFKYQLALFSEDVAGHAQPWYYHILVITIGCFPASVFIWTYKKPVLTDGYQSKFIRWMWILGGVVLILFSLVKTKIVHYSSLTYFPLTFLAAYSLYAMEKRGVTLSVLSRRFWLLLTIVWGALFSLMPMAMRYKQQWIEYIRDPFARANLEADVYWPLWFVLPGLIYLFLGYYLIHRSKFQMKDSVLQFLVLQVIMMQWILYAYVPKIEAYTQSAAIEFYQEHAEENPQIGVLGYKSYAHLFYGKKIFPGTSGYPDTDSLLKLRNTEDTVYFVCKIQDAEFWRSYPGLKELYAKNGFVFLKKQ